jgi:hypothetical protein
MLLNVCRGLFQLELGQALDKVCHLEPACGSLARPSSIRASYGLSTALVVLWKTVLQGFGCAIKTIAGGPRGACLMKAPTAHRLNIWGPRGAHRIPLGSSYPGQQLESEFRAACSQLPGDGEIEVRWWKEAVGCRRQGRRKSLIIPPLVDRRCTDTASENMHRGECRLAASNAGFISRVTLPLLIALDLSGEWATGRGRRGGHTAGPACRIPAPPTGNLFAASGARFDAGTAQRAPEPACWQPGDAAAGAALAGTWMASMHGELHALPSA